MGIIWRLLAGAVLGGLMLGVAACSSAPQDNYWVAKGTAPGFGPYLDLLQWGPNGKGSIVTYGMSVPGDNPGTADQGGGQVITTTTRIRVTGTSNVVITANVGGTPVAYSANDSGATMVINDRQHNILSGSPDVFHRATPSQFNADLSKLASKAPNGFANY
jgi:hypothetical protein